MSGTPSTHVPDRDHLVAVAGELARELREETGRLERDARVLELRGLPLFAANVRSLRGRLVGVLKLADAVARQGVAA